MSIPRTMSIPIKNVIPSETRDLGFSLPHKTCRLKQTQLPSGMTPWPGMHAYLLRGERHVGSVDARRIVPQFDVKSFSDRRRDSQERFHETVRNDYRVAEIGIGADCIDQKKFVSAQSALLLRSRHAAHRLECGNAHN